MERTEAMGSSTWREVFLWKTCRFFGSFETCGSSNRAFSTGALILTSRKIRVEEYNSDSCTIMNGTLIPPTSR